MGTKAALKAAAPKKAAAKLGSVNATTKKARPSGSTQPSIEDIAQMFAARLGTMRRADFTPRDMASVYTLAMTNIEILADFVSWPGDDDSVFDKWNSLTGYFLARAFTIDVAWGKKKKLAEVVECAEMLAKQNGGFLFPNGFMREHGLAVIADAIDKHPKAFKHLPKTVFDEQTGSFEAEAA